MDIKWEVNHQIFDKYDFPFQFPTSQLEYLVARISPKALSISSGVTINGRHIIMLPPATHITII